MIIFCLIVNAKTSLRIRTTKQQSNLSSNQTTNQYFKDVRKCRVCRSIQGYYRKDAHHLCNEGS